MSYGGVDDCIEASLNLQEDALALHKEKVSGKNVNATIYCVECEEEIPLARRNVITNVDRCIECEKLVEKENRNKPAFIFRDVYCP